MKARSLVIFSSLPEVGGHTTTTLKLCELLAPRFDRVQVLVKDIPGHGFSPQAFGELQRKGIQVIRCPGKSPLGWWGVVSKLRGADVFLTIGMRHLSPALAMLISAPRSIYYHITHELTPTVVRQLRIYRLFFSDLVFISPVTAKLFPAKVPQTWALQPTQLPSRPEVRDRQPGVPRLGFLGRLNEAKGIGLLAELVDQSPTPCELHVAGRGPLEETLFHFQQKNPERFFLHGSFSAVERMRFLSQFFAGIDYLCVPSFDDREGIPNVILEALQFGVPVLATRTGGMRSFAMPELGPAPREAVHLVEPEEFAGAFRSLVNDPPPPGEVRNHCVKFFDVFFSDSVLATAWARILSIRAR